MTVKPKVADLLLTGSADLTLTSLDVVQPESDNMIKLQFKPVSDAIRVAVSATLDKPSK